MLVYEYHTAVVPNFQFSVFSTDTLTTINTTATVSGFCEPLTVDSLVVSILSYPTHELSFIVRKPQLSRLLSTTDTKLSAQCHLGSLTIVVSHVSRGFFRTSHFTVRPAGEHGGGMTRGRPLGSESGKNGRRLDCNRTRVVKKKDNLKYKPISLFQAFFCTGPRRTAVA